MKRLLAAAAAVAVCLAFAPGAAGQTVTVKMATLVPEGSSWHLILKQMAEEWKTLSGGKVAVRLYAGGVAGDDPDVVRKMRLGTLNAGVLTATGIGEMDKSVYALGIPAMYQSYEEVYGVLERMRPGLEAKLAAKGFVVLAWADGGWVRYFSQKPVATPDDLRQLKLFTWAGDVEGVELLKAARFHPVPLPSTELSTALQTGLVQAFGAPPQVAAIAQYYNHAKYMTEYDWQLLLGAFVVTKDLWDKIPADLQPQIRASAEAAGKKLRDEIRSSAGRDVEAMKTRGLQVVPVSPAQRAEWVKLVEGLRDKIRGPIVPAEAFDEALRIRDELRGKK
jgi:TRAP-type C4-dicarboxylate transport system substrate-binding protein